MNYDFKPKAYLLSLRGHFLYEDQIKILNTLKEDFFDSQGTATNIPISGDSVPHLPRMIFSIEGQVDIAFSINKIDFRLLNIPLNTDSPKNAIKKIVRFLWETELFTGIHKAGNVIEYSNNIKENPNTIFSNFIKEGKFSYLNLEAESEVRFRNLYKQQIKIGEQVINTNHMYELSTNDYQKIGDIRLNIDLNTFPHQDVLHFSSDFFINFFDATQNFAEKVIRNLNESSTNHENRQTQR